MTFSLLRADGVFRIRDRVHPDPVDQPPGPLTRTIRGYVASLRSLVPS
jgi:hypothetical protein